MKQTQVLTGLNEQELLGLCAQHIGSSTVVAAKVVFRPWIYLKEGKKKMEINNRKSNSMKVTFVFVHYNRIFKAVSFPAAELFIRIFFLPQ